MAKEYVSQIKKGIDTYDIHDDRLNSLATATVGQGLVVATVDEDHNVTIGSQDIALSFNGRTGAITPQVGDYTAEMVGADIVGSANAVNSTLTTHMNNEDIHVTASEKESWDAKQPAITSSSKLSYQVVDGLSTIAHTGNLADAVEDLTHKHVSQQEKEYWNAKQQSLRPTVDYVTPAQLEGYTPSITSVGVLVGTGNEVKSATYLEDKTYQTPQTTLSGYGITDAKISSTNELTLGDKTVSVLSNVGGPDHSANRLTGTIPSTVTYETRPLYTNDTTLATTEFVNTAIDTMLESSKAMTFEGTISNEEPLKNAHDRGDTYLVAVAGTYVGVHCQVGDMIICVNNGEQSSTVTNSDWDVVHTSNGAVNGPSSSVNNHVVVFDGDTGDVIKDSGFTIAKSVPADADFTKYTHPTYAQHTPGIYTIAINSLGHVASATTPTIDEMRSVLPFASANGIGGVKYSQGEITITNWERMSSDDEDYHEDFPIRGQMNIVGVTANHLPEIIFSAEDALLGIYSPTSMSFDGGIYVYATEVPVNSPTVTYKVTSIQ